MQQQLQQILELEKTIQTLRSDETSRELFITPSKITPALQQQWEDVQTAKTMADQRITALESQRRVDQAERATLLAQHTQEKTALLSQLTALEQQNLALTALVADNETTLAEKEESIKQGRLALTKARELGQGLASEREHELEQHHQATLKEQNVMLEALQQQLSELRSASAISTQTLQSQLDQSKEMENTLIDKHSIAMRDLQQQLADQISSSSQDQKTIADLQSQLHRKHEDELALVRHVDELTTIETRATKEILDLQSHAQRSNDELVTARGKYTDLIALSAAAKVAADKQNSDLQMLLKKGQDEMSALVEKHNVLR